MTATGTDPGSFVDVAERSANPFDPVVAADPTPFYSELRDRVPVARMMALPGTHILSRYDDVRFALTHPEIFSSEISAVDIGQQRPLIPLQIDPPDQKKYRRVMDPQLGPKQMASHAERIRALANELIDGFAGAGACDIHAAFTVPFPCTVFAEMCGLPMEELDMFLGWKDDIIRPQVRHPEMAFDLPAMAAVRRATGQAIYDYFGALVAERQADPGDDLFSRFAAGEVDGQRMTRDQLLDIGFLFILGGLDTVTSTLDCGLAHLGRTPALRDELVADPALVPKAVEELLRLHTPVMQVLRVIKEPHEMHGVAMEPGDHVMLMLGAADTDPSEFGVDADAADLDREQNRHLAFGGGPHRCLGSNLARLELRIALEELHRRVPDYTVPDDAELAYSPGIREIEHLPLEFTPT